MCVSKFLSNKLQVKNNKKGWKQVRRIAKYIYLKICS